MANLFINIPVPAANGSGAAVDVSTMGSSKTISLTGPFVATVTIEVSNELVPTDWAPLISFTVPDGIVRDVAARWMRASVADYKSGAPACDVGSDDTGTTFVNLPVPVGNGAGAAVDCTALPLFKTATVAGPFRGNVQIEVSTDGGGSWSQLGMGFNNPGYQNQKLTAGFMRVVRAGVPLIAPGLPIVNIGACAAGGGGGGSSGAVASTCYIFRPGSGEAGPVVFEDMDILYAAIQTARAAGNDTGCFRVEVDDSLAAPAMGAGAFDLSMVTLASVHGQQGGLGRALHFLTLNDGVAITGLHAIDGLTVVKGQSGANPCITLDGDPLTLSGGAGLTGGTNGSLCVVPEGITSFINVLDNSYIGGGDERQAAILVSITGSLQVWLSGTNGANANNVDENAFDDDAGGGVVAIEAMASSSRYYPTQIYLTNPPTIMQSCPWWNYSGDPNGLVQCGTNSGFKLIDFNTGLAWRNVGGTVWVIESSDGAYALPEQWIVEEVDAGVAPTEMSAQVSTSFDQVQAVRAGSIIGLSVRLTIPITSNTITVYAAINGVVTALLLDCEFGPTASGGVATAAVGAIPYAAGDLISVYYESEAGLEPTDSTVEAWLEVAE